MSTQAIPGKSIHVFARWRPLTEAETSQGEIGRQTDASGGDNGLFSVSVNRQSSASDRPWKSGAAFKQVLEPADTNATTFDTTVANAIPHVLEGGSCNVFAYGHSGSGKTHTIIGYDFNTDERLGLCLNAARKLFEAIGALNTEKPEDPNLGVGFSLYELRKNSAFDLLNGRTECFIREGYDGKTHIRGKTQVLEDGKVRVCPIVQRPCWAFDELRKELIDSLGRRAVGSSTIHDQSSRTHAVLELEILNQPLVDARLALIDRQSELVPVAKSADDISIEEQIKGYIRGPDGKWTSNPDNPINQERIDIAEAERAKYQASVTAAEGHVASVLKSSSSFACLGGKMVFVDLAGAEYHHEKGTQAPIIKQTPRERQEGRQINTDLLALKEVIRAWSNNQTRIPFRSSPLTMVLREHFLSAKNGTSAMIVTVSPAKDQYAATLNCLKYGNLVGIAVA
jgi:hypothetical protein